MEEFVCLRYFQIEHFPFSQKEQAHNHHVALLEHHETKQDPHLGIAEGQTKSQCTVCQFVRDRVKRLAQICDLVELSFDHPFKQIRETGEEDNTCGPMVRFFCQIEVTEYRNEEEPKISHQVRNRESLFCVEWLH